MRHFVINYPINHHLRNYYYFTLEKHPQDQTCSIISWSLKFYCSLKNVRLSSAAQSTLLNCFFWSLIFTSNKKKKSSLACSQEWNRTLNFKQKENRLEIVWSKQSSFSGAWICVKSQQSQQLFLFDNNLFAFSGHVMLPREYPLKVVKVKYFFDFSL